MKTSSAYIHRTSIMLFCLFIISIDLHSQNWSGPVGIGTNQPTDLLHVSGGSIQLEGSNQYFKFVTKTPQTTGIRFFNGNDLKGTWLYRSQEETVNLSSNGEIDGLVYDFSKNIALLGRNNQIGVNEKFGLRIDTPKPDFGGMNIETSGNKGSKPYYGYAMNGTQKASHYFDGASQSWKLKVGKEIMTVTSDGLVGIGTNSPVSRLHIHGPFADVNTNPGLLTLGGSNNHIELGISNAGLAQIYSKSANNKLVLGGGQNDVLAVDGTNKRVGIGINNPSYTLDVKSTQRIAVRVVNQNNENLNKVGGSFEVTAEGNGQKYGIEAKAKAGSTQINATIGGKFSGMGNQSSSDIYGVYSSAWGAEDGNQYGIYTTADSADPALYKKSWALYSEGNSYFSERVFIGDEDGATGYKLSVDGKIICEDLQMENSTNWPDYVFAKDYELKSLAEVEAFVAKNNHLPDVPSAQEIKEQGGYSQGEMNRILLKKLEEVTLYLIDQKKIIEKQSKEIQKLKNASKI